MKITTSGTQWDQFLDFLPDEAALDEHDICVNGLPYDTCPFPFAPDAVVCFSGGVVLPSPTNHMEHQALVPYFRKWLKSQSIRHVLVVIDNKDADKVAEAVRAIGGRVVKAF